jgi:hypothetical protein
MLNASEASALPHNGHSSNPTIRLEKLIEQEPLIKKEPTRMGTKNLDSVPADLLFGVGLCSLRNLTQGLPVDTLSMILISEQLGANKYVIVSDSHAKTNGFDPHEVDEVAQEQLQRLQRALKNLDLKNWQITLASEIEGTSDYRQILDATPELLDIEPAKRQYVRMELTDIAWFRQNRSTKLKIGWFKNDGLDEYFFDRRFIEIFPNSTMSFLYVVPGRSFDHKRQNPPPYACFDVKNRILIDRDENVAEKIDFARTHTKEESFNSYMKFLQRLVRLYDRVVGPTDRTPLRYRVQQIVDRCTE